MAEIIIPAILLEANTPLTLAAHIQTLADQCVKCGLCLPHCPTYNVRKNEADSPRGRIALCQAIVNDVSLAQPSLLQHLNSCLQCRSCEKACPSTVAYQQIYTETYHWLSQQTGKSYTSWLAMAVQHPALLRTSFAILWLYQNSGLAWLLRHSGVLRILRLARLERYLPKLHAQSVPASLQAAIAKRGTLAIFTGCIGRHLEQDAINALMHIASRAGYNVQVLPAQVCCGALQHNRGDVSASLHLARANIQAFAKSNADAVVFLASGCGAHLYAYTDLPWSTTEDKQHASDFVGKLHEACAWVYQQTDLPLANNGIEDVAVHAPCSHRNVIGHARVVTQLLQRIPNMKIHTLDSKAGCCGGAGDYPLRQPVLAAQVREPVIKNLLATNVQQVVTTNLGCALSLQAGLQDSSREIKVMHPLILFANAIANDRP